MVICTEFLCFPDPSGRPAVPSFWPSHQTQGIEEHYSELTFTSSFKMKNKLNQAYCDNPEYYRKESCDCMPNDAIGDCVCR